MIKIKLKRKTLLYIASNIALLFLSQRFLFANLGAKLKNARQQIKVEEAKLKINVALKGKKDIILREYKNYQGYFEAKDFLSEKDRVARFLREIQSIIQESGVSLINLSPQDKPEQGPDYKKYKADLRVEAGVEEFLAFLSEAQENNLLIKIDKFSLTPKDENASALKIEAVISMVVL